MRKPVFFITSLLLCLILAVVGLSQCKIALQRFEETRSLMDTYVTVVIYSDEEIAQEAINAAFARMEEVVNIASTFDEQAEAFRLNRDGYLDKPSTELVELIRTSIDYSELTDGSFDITCQPLLDLWQYDPGAEKQFWELDETTQKEQINEALKLIGSDKIVIGEDRISFKQESMKITLGGIAKGYAVDEALKALKNMAIKYALIDAGGDITTLGSKPGGELWNIALANPDDTSQSLAAFEVQGKAVATSGNYQRYFDPNKEVGHIMDPKTGYSATECISVTIVAENCTQADTLATSVFVMGVENGMSLVESLNNVECFIVDDDRIIHTSSGLTAYLSEN